MRNRVRDIRLKKNMAQGDVAKAAGLTQSYLCLIEKGQRTLDLEIIERLAKALKCKPYELLPLEWQPETVSEADLKILKSIKSYATDKQNEEKAKNSQIQKESER